MKNETKPNNEIYFLIIFFILALIIRIIVFFQNGNQAADGMYRTILLINWLKDPYFIIGGLWPPLHIYLMALMMKIYNDAVISPRLVSLIFGTLVIFPYYYLVNLLFDKKTAMISVLILAFLVINIQYGTYSMSEIPFIFFLIVSLYFFFKFKKAGRKKFDLIMSAIFLNFASMIRYEGWLFIPILALFTLDWKKDNLKDNLKGLKDNLYFLFIFLIISMIFPILWAYGNYHLYGDFLYGQSWSDDFIRTNTIINPNTSWHSLSFAKKLIIWPWTSLYVLNVVSVFAVAGLMLSLIKKKNLEFLSIFFILMAIFTYKLFNVTMLPQIRHIMMPIIFLIPYSKIGLDNILYYFVNLNIINSHIGNNKNETRKILEIFIISSFMILSSYMAIVDNTYITPDYVNDVASWLKNNLRSDDRVLLDEYNWWGLHILFYSGFNTTFTENYLKTFEFTTENIKIVPGGGKKIDRQLVLDDLENYKPSYLVYSPKGKLVKILNFSSECQNESFLGYRFECKYTTKNYNIYKINYRINKN